MLLVFSSSLSVTSGLKAKSHNHYIGKSWYEAQQISMVQVATVYFYKVYNSTNKDLHMAMYTECWMNK